VLVTDRPDDAVTVYDVTGNPPLFVTFTVINAVPFPNDTVFIVGLIGG
jgi:hypothetical protein